MNDINIIQLFFYILPAIIVGLVAFYFFRMYMLNEEKRRMFLIRKENQKEALPLRLQAYERMALYLERISFGKLLIRIKTDNLTAEEYANVLTSNIEIEFEHNLAQQIYITGECWNVIKTSKNATIGIIRKTLKQEGVTSADKLREVILAGLMEQQAPTETALDYIKKEVRSII
ncbi:hypothetical protein [Gillisia sp. Hel_I_29]|uniref:DUF7935 family protein n=1 Tax=Gillisia sp. Hel_I_29 TaxID=1249975 RepID=UPI000554819C|nr:hypothetical protein [Gillisia sp. Hel_I_29]